MQVENDNNIFPGCWQVVLVGVLIVGALLFCAYVYNDITITTTPPRPTPAPAPTATPSPLYVILTEQAKASARVQVITAETDNEIKLRWNIHYMRRFWGWYFLIPLALVLAVVILGVVIWLKLGEVLKDGGSYD